MGLQTTRSRPGASTWQSCSACLRPRSLRCASSGPSFTRGPQGELLGSCPKVPADLEARVGYHIDNQDPPKKERVFGYLQHKTTDINVELGLELPVGNSTYPAHANEGNHFTGHRAKVALPWLPGQVQVLDGSYDQSQVYQEIRQHRGIPIIATTPGRGPLPRGPLGAGL